MPGSPIISLSDRFTRVRQPKCAPERVLLLVPACLQWSQCEHTLANDDLSQCERCGNCKIKDVLELADEFGVRPFVAAGGRLAAHRAKSDDIDAIVAIACAKELKEGVKAVFPKPMLTVCNEQPHGPCVDTDVELTQVREAIEFLTQP